MLRPLQEADFPAAAELLAEGFPVRSAHFWDAGLRSMQLHSHNQTLGIPLGWLMLDGTQPVAVALTPASYRTRSGAAPERLVNLASWYIRPQYRWRAATMLKAMQADPAATYIDVTPTEVVAQMLTMMGFRAVNSGTVLAAVAGHAWRRAQGASLRELMPGDELPSGSPPRQQIDAHREFACVPVLLEHGSQRTLLIYRARRMRGLAVARLKFIGSHRALHQHFGAVARYFLARGFVFLSWDRRVHTPASLFSIPKSGGIWYARGGDFEDRTDFIGTELSMLNF